MHIGVRVLALLAGATFMSNLAVAQTQPRPRAPITQPVHPQQPLVQPPQQGQAQSHAPRTSASGSNPIVTTITLADLGHKNGIRFAYLGGRRELFVPIPQTDDLSVTDLVLVLDDLSAYEARRNIEVLINDRSVAAITLDGKSTKRTVRVPLGNTKPHDGYVKLSFIYAGAATQDRCIDVRYVGDSLTVQPESGLEIEFDPAKVKDIATISALMPRSVTVLLPTRHVSSGDYGAAIMIGRSLIATGRRVAFHRGNDRPPELVDKDGRRRWTTGLIVIGTPGDVTGSTSATFVERAEIDPSVGEIAAIRVGGIPALLVSEGAAGRAALLLGTPALGASRGLSNATVAKLAAPKPSGGQISFDQLGIVPPTVEIFGRAEISVAIDTRRLPANTRISRIILDLLVAPDGTGEKAVISVFLNDRLITSAVAAQDDATHIELQVPRGLIETVASLRAVVQRRSLQGDCRYEAQGYPAQILGSSTVILSPAGPVHDFAEIITHWANGIEVIAPAAAAERPDRFLGLMSLIVSDLSSEFVPLKVRFVDNDSEATPSEPFLAVGTRPPNGSDPSVRFDRGRVVVTDRTGQALLDIGGYSNGAVAQIVNANGAPGIWIHSLSSDGTLPDPPSLGISRGNVAFIDQTGIALAMSTEREKLIHIDYPEQTSWTQVASRFRTWVIGALWLLATVVFLYALQRMWRSRSRTGEH